MSCPWLVILNWNGRDRLPISLGSVGALEGRFEVLVVDNGSGDGSAELVTSILPSAHLLRNGANLGFAEGNNRGIAYALDRGATHVALINDDMRLDPRWLVSLLAEQALHPEAGILGGLVLFLDRPEVVNSTGIEVDALGRARDRDFERPLAALARPASEGVLAVTGGAMLIDRRVLDAVGALDARLFAYYEDYDLCLRARAAGFHVRYAAGARSWHRYAASTGPLHPFRLFLLARNQMRLVGRYGAPPAVPFLLLGTALYRLCFKFPTFVLRGYPHAGFAEARAAFIGFGLGMIELCRRVRPVGKGIPR